MGPYIQHRIASGVVRHSERGVRGRTAHMEPRAGLPGSHGSCHCRQQQQQQQQQQVWGFVVKSLSIYSMHHARYCLATGNSLCCYPQQQQQQQEEDRGGAAGAKATMGVTTA